MGKIRKMIMAAALLLTMVPVLQSQTTTVQAQTSSHYTMACSAYEVDTIDDNGNFVLSGCYGDFSSAKTAMQAAGNDAVVRSGSSLSANQIVAMTRGYVYSYARRDGSATLTITQNVSSEFAKTTYINNYRGMYYIDTTSYDGNGDGTVLVNAFGFEGNVSLRNVDFIPQKFAEKGLGLWVGGNDNTADHESEWYVIPGQTYYSVEQNGNYLDLVYHSYSSDSYNKSGNNNAIDITYGGLAVGPAASWMKAGDVFYSINDTDYYYNSSLTSQAGTYWNYYQWVSLRSKSNISADTMNSFMSAMNQSASNGVMWNQCSAFVSDQTEYGINAAMVFSQACIESAYGTSYLAKSRYNLFGVNALDSNANAAYSFSSTKDCIDNQMALFLRNYTDTDDRYFFGGHFGNKGSGITVKYASSAIYGLTLSSMYYKLDKYASGNNGTLTDYYSSCVGVVNTYGASVYSSADGSNVMYTTEYGATYQKNFTVVILGETGDYYKVQSTDYVSNGSRMTGISGTKVDYNWDTMVGYIKKSDVTVVSGTVPASETVTSIEMYRLYNPNSGEHFYTADVTERDGLVVRGWRYEGVGWNAPSTSSTPVYRLYNPNSGDHFYTVNAAERDGLVRLGWNDEGIGWYSDDAQAVPVYRQYNPNEVVGTHNYTTDKTENDWLVTLGWRAEGIGWYALN